MSTFDELVNEVESEAQQEGLAAVLQLRTLEVKYRLINALIMARRERHLTQTALAEMTGVGQPEISNIERGRTSPTMDTYARLAAAVGIDFAPTSARTRADFDPEHRNAPPAELTEAQQPGESKARHHRPLAV